ncbi:2949_t:CDS:2 [Cetraspora pellucida]|uniref:2949_t:CDS:1 n=1 Tax=Cetraspora pellucida TaxID=1433469 RepID=A0ACA9M970_9GLOM|nr:2949_t:CDS:2 [Cetraspora pellucida]
MRHDQELCSKLLSQLRKYKSRKAPFDQPYNSKLDMPIIYASCERSFSVFEIDINTSEVYTLNIINSIDVRLQIFNIDRKANDEIIVSPRRQTIILDSQHNDFDIETLARNMLMEIDNNENS